MYPLLLDMTKLECKKSLRSLELEAYSMIITAFRAQGDLTPKKIDLLKELQTIFKISVDRHKSELRRACNDDKLYTIAKLLSHGDCVSTEWIKQSKRSVPLLPSLQSSNNYYRILADQILSKAEPVFSLYPEENSNKIKCNETCVQEEDSADKNLVFLKNGYAVDSKYVKVENTQPSEFMKRFESSDSSNSKTFLNYLIQKFKSQQPTETPITEPEPSVQKTVTIQSEQDKPIVQETNKVEIETTNKKLETNPVEIVPQNLIETSTVTIKTESDIFNGTLNSLDSSLKPQTLIPIQIPIQIQTPSSLKLNQNHMIKLNPSQTKTPKLLIPAKNTVNPQKLIILPSNSNTNGNLKILTMTQQTQKILLNVPSVTKPVDSLKRKINETCLKNSSSNSNLVCLKLENFNEESNSSTSSRNGFYDFNGNPNSLSISNSGSNSKKIKLIEFNPTQNSTVINLIKANSNTNLANSD